MLLNSPATLAHKRRHCAKGLCGNLQLPQIQFYLLYYFILELQREITTVCVADCTLHRECVNAAVCLLVLAPVPYCCVVAV